MIEEIDNYLEIAQGRLPEYYKNEPNIEAILEILEAPIQDAESAIIQFLDERSISTAIGVQLDRLGEYFLLTRDSDTDDAYRARLISRVSELTKAGQMQVLIDTLKGLTGSTQVYAQSVYPQTAILLAEIDAPLADESAVLAGMNRVKAQGTQLGIQVTLPLFFTFLESELATSRGFSADEDTGAPLTRAIG